MADSKWDFDTADCPVCERECDTQSGARFWCENCGRWFAPSEGSVRHWATGGQS